MDLRTAFNITATARQAALFAGLSSDPTNPARYFLPMVAPVTGLPWLEVSHCGRAAVAHNWPGLCPIYRDPLAMDAGPASGPAIRLAPVDLDPWGAFVALVHRGNVQAAIEAARKLPTVRAEMHSVLGELAMFAGGGV